MEIHLRAWNHGSAKKAITDFVARVTTEGSKDFVAPEARVAVFDNDGTLWCEKPMYIQLDFLLRKLAAQAEADAGLRQKQPWKAAYDKDFGWLGGAVTKHYQGDDSDVRVLLGGLLQLAQDQPVEKVEAEAKTFVETQHHPTLGRLYFNCAYQPMIELLRYLEANDFVTYIVSGGGRDFMRGVANDLYGVPRERIIGSTVVYRYVDDDSGGSIVQMAKLDVLDDGPAKPVAIWNVIGRRPIMSVGNSNGDLPMLRFTGGPSLPALRMLVLHDDAAREFDYVAGADQALEAAKAKGWTVISVKDDWKQVF
jgi:phosphoglycolate phosphatase-like HAD superfamily hydrolase